MLTYYQVRISIYKAVISWRELYSQILLQSHYGTGILECNLTWDGVQFAGAAQSLGAGALLVNPFNVQGVYAAIAEAVKMTETERNERHQLNYNHVTTHTAEAWAHTYLR